ncbi:hypothetical protein SOVF_068370 [Spinacia oleracea]|nr:hypothetical protein SOVF_068370 [Spinacia oleracea]
MAFFKHWNCLNMALTTKHKNGAAFPRLATDSNDVTTDCICWQYSLYLL